MTQRALVTVLAVAATTWAAPLKQPIGSAKEDEPCPEVPPQVVSPADLALLRALSWAVEPAPVEVRVQAIEDLGFLGDPRVLNLAAQLATDLNPKLARAALRAVGAIRHPRAEEILANVVRHPLLPESSRAFALELLPFQNTWSAIDFVHASARNSALSPAVQMTARRVALGLPTRPAAAPPAAVSPRGDAK